MKGGPLIHACLQSAWINIYLTSHSEEKGKLYSTKCAVPFSSAAHWVGRHCLLQHLHLDKSSAWQRQLFSSGLAVWSWSESSAAMPMATVAFPQRQTHHRMLRRRHSLRQAEHFVCWVRLSAGSEKQRKSEEHHSHPAFASLG